MKHLLKVKAAEESFLCRFVFQRLTRNLQIDLELYLLDGRFIQPAVQPRERLDKKDSDWFGRSDR